MLNEQENPKIKIRHWILPLIFLPEIIINAVQYIKLRKNN